jgi:hypothetical protein
VLYHLSNSTRPKGIFLISWQIVCVYTKQKQLLFMYCFCALQFYAFIYFLKIPGFVFRVLCLFRQVLYHLSHAPVLTPYLFFSLYLFFQWVLNNL